MLKIIVGTILVVCGSFASASLHTQAVSSQEAKTALSQDEESAYQLVPAAEQPPLNMELIGQWGGLSTAVALRNGYGYQVVGNRLVAIDLTDARNPREVDSEVIRSNLNSANVVAMVGQYAYVVASPTFTAGSVS